MDDETRELSRPGERRLRRWRSRAVAAAEWLLAALLLAADAALLLLLWEALPWLMG